MSTINFFDCSSNRANNSNPIQFARFLDQSCNLGYVNEARFKQDSINLGTVNCDSHFINNSVNSGNVNGTGFVLGDARNLCSVSHLITGVFGINYYALSKFEDDDICSLKSFQINDLTTGQIQNLSNSQVCAFTSGQIETLTSGQFNYFTTGQIQYLFDVNISGYEILNTCSSANESQAILNINPCKMANLINCILCCSSQSYLKFDAGKDFANETIPVNNYFSGYWNNNWFDKNNWFFDSSFVNELYEIPNSQSIAIMYGDPALINLDNPNWIQPSLIDTRNISSEIGICLYSQNNAVFSGQICGNAELYGNARFL